MTLTTVTNIFIKKFRIDRLTILVTNFLFLWRTKLVLESKCRRIFSPTDKYPNSNYQWRHLSANSWIHIWNWPVAILWWDCCCGTCSEKCCLAICSVNEDFGKSRNWNWKINSPRRIFFDEYLWCAIRGIWPWQLHWKYCKNQGEGHLILQSKSHHTRHIP